MTTSRFFLLASALATAFAIAAGCSDASVAQGVQPPCGGGACACDDLFAPLSPCLDVPFAADAQGELPCVVIEATDTAPCACDGPGRSAVSAPHMCAVDAAMAASTMTWSCFCEVTQTTGEDQTSCRNDKQPVASAEGWCYVDDSSAAPTGNPALVESCPTTEKHAVRFVGAGAPSANASLFIACGQ